MENILDQLIPLAERLNGESEQFIEKEIITQLQQEQQVMIEDLMKLDKIYQKESNGFPSLEVVERIKNKLKYFQELNNIFQENICASQAGLIQFEEKKRNSSLLRIKLP